MRLTLTLELEGSLLVGLKLGPAKRLKLEGGMLLAQRLERVLLLGLELWLGKTLVLAMILLLSSCSL